MPETEVIAKKEGTGKIMSAGKVESFKPNITLSDNQNNEHNQNDATATTDAELNETEKANVAAGLNKDGTKIEIAAAGAITDMQKAENLAKGLNEDGSTKATNEPPKQLSKEEIKALYDEAFPTTPVLTDEDKQKQADAFEKRMLDLYVDGGGKIEEFALLKQVASTDLTEITKTELTKELKTAGFNETEIAAIQKERYYQLEQAEIDEIDDPAEKALAQKKLDYGKSKLENKGKIVKENAVDFLNNLKEAVNQKDFFTQKESEFVSNVEAHFKEVPRKMTLELGKMDDIEIPPVEYEVPEDAIAKAQETLKNPASRKQLLFNTTDGSLNLKSIAELVLKAEMFDSAAKTMYLTGGHREVEKFEKIFPKNPNALGVGGNNQANTGKPGKLVKAGPPERFRPAVNQ